MPFCLFKKNYYVVKCVVRVTYLAEAGDEQCLGKFSAALTKEPESKMGGKVVCQSPARSGLCDRLFI